MDHGKLELRTWRHVLKLACWCGFGCGIHVMLIGFLGAKIDLLCLGMVAVMVVLYGMIGDKP